MSLLAWPSTCWTFFSGGAVVEVVEMDVDVEVVRVGGAQGQERGRARR